jgi:hypothetical protein
MWFEGENKSLESKNNFYTIQNKYLINENILTKISLLKKVYVDDTNQDSIRHFNNYLNDYNTYQEICDNVLCTGIQIFF